MYIEGIELERFSATDQGRLPLSLQSFKLHVVFYSFMSNNRKQYSDTTAEHSKHIIELLRNRKLLFSGIVIIWNNTDVCADHYIYAT